MLCFFRSSCIQYLYLQYILYTNDEFVMGFIENISIKFNHLYNYRVLKLYKLIVKDFNLYLFIFKIIFKNLISESFILFQYIN